MTDMRGNLLQFKDAARLLNFYQLWLDDLFPRAKFADGLTMIEKLGHSKRIQVMRREWIDEEKPRLHNSELTREELENHHVLKDSTNSNHNTAAIPQSREATPDQDLFIPDPDETARPTISFPGPEDDDLDDLLREQDDTMTDLRPEMPASSSRAPNGDDDEYDADYEAMKELGM